MFETIAHSGLGMFVTTVHPSLGLYSQWRKKDYSAFWLDEVELFKINKQTNKIF